MSSRACVATGFCRTTVAAVCLTICCAATSEAQSVLDGFNPGADAEVQAIAVQPDGKILVGGFFTAMGGGGFGATGRSHVARLNVDGTVDETFNPGANGAVYAFAVQPDGKIVVAGLFTMVGGGGAGTTQRAYLARLNADGSLDISFAPGANGPVTAVALQADGRILVGGEFTMIGGGGSGTTARSRIARLAGDGSLDLTFDPGANAKVNTLAIQRDGRIVVGGEFTMLGGGGTGTSNRSRVGRLNGDGSIDGSFNPGAGDTVHAVVVQADGRILVGGAFMTLGGGGVGTTARHRIGRLQPDGALDLGFNPGADGTILSLALQPDGKIVAGGSFTGLGNGTGVTPRSNIGRLNANGSLVDPGFNPGADFEVRALALQMDAKILVGGAFGRLGQSAVIARNYIGRLYPEGRLDSDLNPGVTLPPGAFYAFVTAISVQPDGKIAIGGLFSSVGGSGGVAATQRQNIARLNADGSLDTGFNPGASLDVQSLVALPDGKLLVGGYFTTIGGGGFGSAPRRGIARLNADGTVDLGFDGNPDAGLSGLIRQPDGRILVCGAFTMIGGGVTRAARPGIARLHADGTLDTSFNPGPVGYGNIAAMALQPDGKILVAGSSSGSMARLNADGSRDLAFNVPAIDLIYAMAIQPDGKIVAAGLRAIARLHPNGAIDTTFNPGANGGIITTLALQSNGQILVGGTFTALGPGATPRRNIGRLNPDGSVDVTFDPGASDTVNAFAIQPDGKIVVGGSFATMGGGGMGTVPRKAIARLATPVATAQSLGVSVLGDTITWLRGGMSPEVDRVTFELSPTGAGFTTIGDATRVSGGWQLTGLSLPTHQNLYIRARGYYSTGPRPSVSFVDTYRNAYVAPMPPSVSTTVASGVTQTGATLAAEVNPNELDTTVFFEHGASAAYGMATPATSIGAGPIDVAVASTIGGLTCRTTYHFRVTATNVAGTTHGPDTTFTTPDGCSFMDDPLVPGVTAVKVAHIMELRSRIDALRVRFTLPAFGWTDAPLQAGAIVRARHLLDARSALADVYVAAGRLPPAYDPVLAAGAPIRALHLSELRAAILAVE